MGNKQQLQLNNETLGSILSNVLGLPSQESLKHGAYVWKKLTAQAGDFIDFVVSNSPTAYPDGGYKSGYWYEKVKGIDPSLFGCTKYAVDKFTFSSQIASEQAVLNHSLGRVPRIAVLVPDANISGTQKFHTGVAVFLNGGSSGSMGYIILGGSGSESTSSSVSLTANNTTIKLRSYSGYYFATGVEYTLITMA